MKKLAAILCFSALAIGAFAQGQINFQNGGTTLVSYQTGSMSTPAVIPAGVGGQYYFGIFSAPANTTDPLAFTFTGAYGTNLAAAGRIFGGTAATVTGWAAGVSRAVLVRGWSSDIGHDWNPAWLTGISGGGPNSVFGTSSIFASMTAGGLDAQGNSVPAPVLFSSTGITTGFTLVPEPTTMALAGLGAAALLIFRRRK